MLTFMFGGIALIVATSYVRDVRNRLRYRRWQQQLEQGDR